MSAVRGPSGRISLAFGKRSLENGSMEAQSCRSWSSARNFQKFSLLEERLRERLVTRASPVNSSVSEQDEEEENKRAEELMEYFKVFIEGRDAVNTVLKRMMEIIEDKIRDGNSEDDAIFFGAAIVVQENFENLDRSFLMALDVEIKNAEEDDVSKKVLETLKEQVLLQLTSAFPPHVRVVSILTSTRSKETRKEVLCQSLAGGGIFKTEEGSQVEVPASDMQSITRQADDLIHSMEDRGQVTDRKLLCRLVLVREEARSMVAGGFLDERNDTRKFRNVHATHVDLMAELMQLQGKQLVSKLREVLSGDENTEESKPSDKRPIYPGEFLDSLTRINKKMCATESGKGISQLQWVRHEVLKVVEELAFPVGERKGEGSDPL